MAVGEDIAQGDLINLGPYHQATAWAPGHCPPHRYATTPTASSCTAGDPSTSVRPVTASSTAPCIMMGTFASTCPHKVNGLGGPPWPLEFPS